MQLLLWPARSAAHLPWRRHRDCCRQNTIEILQEEREATKRRAAKEHTRTTFFVMRFVIDEIHANFMFVTPSREHGRTGVILGDNGQTVKGTLREFGAVEHVKKGREN